MVECQTINRGDGGLIPHTVDSKLIQFRSQSGVYARESKRSHAWARTVTCSGLANSREGQF